MSRGTKRPLFWVLGLAICLILWSLSRDEIVPQTVTNSLQRTTPLEIENDVDPQHDPPHWHASHSSQFILRDPTPRIDFQIYADKPALNHEDQSGNIFALFLCARTATVLDADFAATQQIVFRLLWQFRSIHQVVVFVCPWTSVAQRIMLRGQGAVVQELRPPSTSENDEQVSDEFIKLQLWNATAYQKIALLDTAAFPTTNIDDVFDLVQPQKCRPPEEMADRNCTYTFAAVKLHDSEIIDNGFFLLSPDAILYQALVTASQAFSSQSEQNFQTFLGSPSAFGPVSTFPAQHLPAIWCHHSLNPQESEQLSQVKVLHSPLWNTSHVSQDPLLRNMWDLSWLRQCRWYDGAEFRRTRETGIYRTDFSIFVENLADIEAKEAQE